MGTGLQWELSRRGILRPAAQDSLGELRSGCICGINYGQAWEHTPGVKASPGMFLKYFCIDFFRDL
jgi:hypothetical protein